MRFLLSLCLVMGISALHAEPRNAEKKATDNIPLKLWYNTPARYFEEALPIGNGKIGAMVYSGGETDSLQLNDITLWSGKPVNHEDDREAHKWLPKIGKPCLGRTTRPQTHCNYTFKATTVLTTCPSERYTSRT